MSIATEITRLQTAKADLKTAIEGKGVTVPSATKIDGYADLVDSIPSGGGGEDKLSILLNEGSLGDYLNNSITNVRVYSFYEYQGITGFSSSSVTHIKGAAFRNCRNLVNVHIPNLSDISNGGDIFNSCEKLQQAMFPRITSGAGSAQFYNCKALSVVDLGKATTIGSNFFTSCTVLSTIILRRDTNITSLGNINSFNGTPFASGGSGGTIYIPESLYNHLGDNTSLDYQKATNWATLHGYGTITWAKLEGSQYENPVT